MPSSKTVAGEVAHAIVHRAVSGKRCSGPKLALSLRCHEIEAALASEESAARFSRCFSEVRNPVSAAKAFGLGGHPRLSDAVRMRASTAEKRRLLKWGRVLSRPGERDSGHCKGSGSTVGEETSSRDGASTVAPQASGSD